MALDDFVSPSYGTFAHKCVDLVAGSNMLVEAESNEKVNVFLFLLSGDTTGAYVLYSGANKLFTFYGLEYFGIPLASADLRIPTFITNLGESLTLLLPSGAVGSTFLRYRVETVLE